MIDLRMIRKIRIVLLSTHVRKFRVNPVEMHSLPLIYAQKLKLRKKKLHMILFIYALFTHMSITSCGAYSLVVFTHDTQNIRIIYA